MDNLTKPNAFVFKAFIDGQYRVCVCPRIDNKWNESEIVYIQNYDGSFDDVLDEKLFSVLFVGYIPSENGAEFRLKNINSQFLKSDKDVAQEMYNNGNYFSTIEKGYQLFYEQPERQGEQTETNQ